MKQPIWFLVPAAVLALTACGQRGPLYLPERSGTVITRPATTTAPPSVQPTTQPTQPAPQDVRPTSPESPKEQSSSESSSSSSSSSSPK